MLIGQEGECKYYVRANQKNLTKTISEPNNQSALRDNLGLNSKKWTHYLEQWYPNMMIKAYSNSSFVSGVGVVLDADCSCNVVLMLSGFLIPSAAGFVGVDSSVI